ncbi:hypothetical protein DCS32_15485 [Dokdonia sp. Dokd-P16]|uniref:hypothetical protein n=1 Tax=Dokdonia sp. Dokd-P16 TaxID=2173169 RepID=UPI000D547469|nr:hypothetical protein [Dokdonia sp. Dokd-P16]AWH75514.1 hypothetical protein DCS32_15485 [Dokdonia sp. Dokd-P16]
MKDLLILGNTIENIKCESFKDSETGRIRVRPLKGQGLPTKIVIECSSSERKAHPIGTNFKTINVKVCKKADGRFYLRAKNQWIEKI